MRSWSLSERIELNSLGAIALSAVAALTGCSELAVRPLKLTVEPRWVRTALPSDYAGVLPGHDKGPLVVDDMVFVPSPIEGVIAFDRKSGAERWRFRLSEGVSGGLAHDGKLLFFGGGNGQFYALDAHRGQIQWVFPLRSEPVSTPVLSDGNVLVLSGSNILVAIERETGRQQWLYSRPQATSITVKGGSEPAVAEGTIYCGFSDGAIAAIKAKDGSLVWERQLDRDPRFRDVDSGPVVVGDTLLTSSFEGGFFSLKRSTGEIQWKIDEGAVHPMTIADGVGFVSNTSGQVHAIDLASGKRNWTYDLEDGIASRPFVFREFIIFGDSTDGLRILDRRTGTLVSTFTTGRGVLAALSGDPQKGELFALSSIGNIYKLDVNWRRLF